MQMDRVIVVVVVVVVQRFNIPLNALQVISGTIFTCQMTKPTVLRLKVQQRAVKVSRHSEQDSKAQLGQSTEGNQLVVEIGLNTTRTTPPCYNNTTLGNRLYAQREGPNVTNSICLATAHIHVSMLLTVNIVSHNPAQSCSDNIPS